MPTNYPTNLDSFLPHPLPDDPRDDPSLAGKVTNLEDAVEALQEFVGTDDSAVPGTVVYRLDQLQTRQTATATTGSLATGATTTATPITLTPSYRLLTMTVTRPARVRLYTDAASQTADLNRPAGVNPVANSGLMLDYVAVAAGIYKLSPLVDGYTTNGSATVPMTVTNNDSVTGTVQVSFDYLITQA